MVPPPFRAARGACAVIAWCLVSATPAPAADGALFDLTGPTLQIAITHQGTTLPLAQVPALAAGDRIRIASPAPADHGARFAIVLAFLRGAISPPPRDWLIEAQPWNSKRATIDAVVPAGAEQAVVLLVPDTGGATKAVGSAVRGKPGAFVRAAEELNQASLDRARLDAYLAAAPATTGAATADTTARLARSLAVKVDPACLARPPEAQAACLARGGGTVLPDAQTSSLAQTLAGAPADVALQLSSTPQAGFGYYSPYIGLIRDFARIVGAFQSAQLQFIPALEVQRGDETRLLLDAAPSFRRPQSVLVAPLPSIAPAAPPPLVSTASGALCPTRTPLLLPVAGAPLVYATAFARNMALRVTTAGGGTLDLPVAPDAVQGGYRVAPTASAAVLSHAVTGQLHGSWGFQPFDGPSFRFVSPDGVAWHVADRASLVVGRESPLTLEGGAAPCVDDVTVAQDGETRAVTWRMAGDHALSLKVPLADVTPGSLTLAVRSAGVADPQRLAVRAYDEASRLSSFTLHAGDREGVLVGTRLDQVATLEIDGTTWRPGALGRTHAADRLTMTTDAATGTLHAGDVRLARVTLTDGRETMLKVTVAPPRPTALLVDRSVERVGPAPRFPIILADPAVMPQNARLVFSLRVPDGARLTPSDRVEIGTDDGLTALLPLTLQDRSVAVAQFVPATALGPAGFGPLRFRLVQGGEASDWQPLVTAVRLPTITGFACSGTPARCTLSGERLFLLRQVIAGAVTVAVPDGFTGSTLAIPAPAEGRLTLRLRDAPAAPASLAVPS